MEARRITPDIMRAETKLRHVERAWAASNDLHQARWSERRLRVIANMDPDVQKHLVTLGVLLEQDVKDSVPFVGRP